MDRPPHLHIDLNEAPSPPPGDTPTGPAPSPPREFAPPVFAAAAAAPPPPPPPPQQQLIPPLPLPQPQPPQQAPVNQQLRLEAWEMVLRVHPPTPELMAGAFAGVPAGVLPGVGLPLPPPPPPPPLHPGEAGWGFPPRPCAACRLPETPGGTMVCDACDRGFHPTCVRVWPPLVTTPPPPPGPPGARRPQYPAANEDWICPECEMRGARTSRWKLGPIALDINATPREDPAAPASAMEITRTSVSDGAQLSATQLPHFEGAHFKNTILFDGAQPMPGFDLAHCLGIRQNFTSMEKQSTSDGSQRSSHVRRRREIAISQASTVPKFADNHEPGLSTIFMDPSFLTKAMEPNSSENRSILKPPKFLVENSNHLQHNHTVGLPIQYGDFYITSMGEIDIRNNYHNNNQIWPVGFMSYWHDRVTGSLFECEVCDGGNFGPMFKVRRLPCSVFPLPNASTTLCENIRRKADTVETKESSSLVEETTNDTDDNILMLLSEPSETNPDFLSCLGNDRVSKRTSECINVESANIMMPTPLSQSGTFSWGPSKESKLHDKIGEFTFEGITPSSVWRMIYCAVMEACEKMYKEHGHLVFFCKHSGETPSDYRSGFQNTDGPCNPLTRFCSSYGPSIPQHIEKESDVESVFALLKEWLYHDRIGFDLEFVQEIVEFLPKSRSCSNYQFLCKRPGFISSLTVASGSLLAVDKNSQSNGDVVSYGRHGTVVTGLKNHAQPSIRELPLGNPIGHKLPPELAGDVFQILECLGRFAEIIGLKEIPSIEQLEDELIDPWPICANQKDIQHLRDHTPPMNSPANVSTSYSNGESGVTTNDEMVSVFIPVETSSTREAAQDKMANQALGRCSGVVLPGIHLALLRVLFAELLSKVAIFVDPSVDLKESKSRRGRKRDADNLISTKELKIDMLTANKLTWPELARRYILAVSSIGGCMDLSDISSREGVKLFRCLHGDGGILCGALPGVAGMEKDALLLAEAENLICNSSANERNKVFMMDYKDTDTVDSPEEPASDISTLPDWAKPLEPVRKLPTNVGTRIRKCVYEALEMKPPEWARKILEHSISKEVYKGNASGPTKKAVLSVLTEACRLKVPQNPEKPRKEKNIISISEAILKKCRIALRRAISSDESKLFGNLLGTTLTNSTENEDEGILGFPGMVSRPLDFRTIDIRLAMGSYCGSWEAFHGDVQEVIHNLHTAFGDRPDVVEMIVALCQSFESLYKTEVLDLVQKFDNYLSSENTDSDIHEELHDILTAANNLPKAPWEDGVCKVCGIDRDDESVLLCDKCDSEYHTYCLNPPLARIPHGNWYCPSCISGEKKAHPDQSVSDLIEKQDNHIGEEAHAYHASLNKLAMAMEEKEYWELSIPERTYLLKFLCDEVLSTALIREHIDQCSDKSGDLQQKFRSLNYELKELKYKKEIMMSDARQSRWSKNEHLSNSSGLVENQPHGTPTASEHHEEAERVNVGVNLNHPDEGAPAGPLNVDRPNKTDNVINNTSTIEGNKSLRLSKQASGIATDQIDVDAIGEVSQGSEKALGGKNDTCDNLNAREAPFATDISAPNEELPNERVSTSLQGNPEASTGLVDHDTDNSEMNKLSDVIAKLQDAISTVESQLAMASLRRECLGKDSMGRLYWVIGRPRKRPCLVADGSMLIPSYRNMSMASSSSQSTYDCRGWNSASLVMYESDEEIKSLVEWLRDYDPREKELKDSILLWQRLLYYQSCVPLSDPSVSKVSKSEQLMDFPNTKAFVILEQKYGLQLDHDTSDVSKRRGRKTKLGSEERAYRCDCLEPIWPSRHHCTTCHETYLTLTEYEGHNAGQCYRSSHSPNESKASDEPRAKGTKTDTKEKDLTYQNCPNEPSSNRKLESCPFDFDEICKKFVTNDSNKETVKEIGLIGSNGVPSFVPSPAFFLEQPAMLNQDKRHELPNDWTSSLDDCQAMSAKSSGQEESKSGQDCPVNSGEKQVPKSRKTVRDSASGEVASSAADKPTRLLAVNGGLVPELSLRPVTGRNSHILKQLKINLLDVDAALPEEALRASKSQQIKRRSWRAFVKEAESISQVVLATNLLERMIKAEFLKNDWWYWSSLTAAIKTSTVSSLALRIFTLDDCIIYAKDPVPNTEPADNAKSVNKGKRRREADSLAS